ncbi:unnamed protein product [Thlaspi arvense]|uniref:RNase H type-1 domain-containing protein n=1 Tax=Thlaspi arvense TaxID=13288 RepID=A0AAU9SNP1_THLAR|nr:unnamed protein product [Thlaspi arvense]
MSLSALELVDKAVREATVWHSANLPPNPSPPKISFLPTPAVSTCQTDGAWHAHSQIGGMGWIIQNPQGKVIIKNSSVRHFVSSAIVAEALAILAALCEAASLEIRQLHLQSDSEILINTLVTVLERIEIAGILTDIRSLEHLFSSLSFSFIPQSANCVANGLAKSAILALSPLGPL